MRLFLGLGGGQRLRRSEAGVGSTRNVGLHMNNFLLFNSMLSLPKTVKKLIKQIITLNTFNGWNCWSGAGDG